MTPRPTHQSLAEFGHRFIVEPQGTTLTQEEREQLQQLQPQAIMLRARNFLRQEKPDGPEVPWEATLNTLAALLADIKSCSAQHSILVSIDHEGGRVIRPPLPISRFPYPAYWGDALPQVVHAMALELKGLGVNVIFGPVADIHSNPNNPVIGERAFGRSADEVIPRIRQYARIMAKQGLLTCAKHFPGHGDTAEDTHFSLPCLQSRVEDLYRRELLPFQALIEEGVPMVMTAHILFPNIDPGNPATISPRIMKDLLRKELGFSGVTVADAIGMDAIRPRALTLEFAHNVLQSEIDLLCVVGPGVSIKTALDIAANMQLALEKSPSLQDACAAARRRVTDLVLKSPQHSVTPLDPSLVTQHHALAESLHQNKPWSSTERAYIPEGF